MIFKFKEYSEDDVVYSDDLYYDLFEGGYLAPEKLLDKQEDIDKVKDAIDTVCQYLDQAMEVGLVEVS